jgi:hypothetical protein
LYPLYCRLGVAALVGIASALALTIEPIATPNSIGMLGREGAVGLPWVIGATSWTRLTLRDWIVTLAVLAFVGLNFFLWSLPISQTLLFLICFPLGIVALAAFMQFAPRK